MLSLFFKQDTCFVSPHLVSTPTWNSHAVAPACKWNSVLLCFIEPILGILYGFGVSSSESRGTHPRLLRSNPFMKKFVEKKSNEESVRSRKIYKTRCFGHKSVLTTKSYQTLLIHMWSDLWKYCRPVQFMPGASGLLHYHASLVCVHKISGGSVVWQFHKQTNKQLLHKQTNNLEERKQNKKQRKNRQKKNWRKERKDLWQS